MPFPAAPQVNKCGVLTLGMLVVVKTGVYADGELQ